MKIIPSDSIATLSCLYLAYGCVCAATAELNDWNRLCGPQIYDIASQTLTESVC